MLGLPGCGGGGGGPNSTTSDDPPVVEVTDLEPTECINGIWEGQFTRNDVPGTDPEIYTVGMLFYTPAGDTLDIAVVEDSTGTCGATVRATEIPGYNMFMLETLDPDVTDCNYATPGVDGMKEVDLAYTGIGAIVDVDGTNTFTHLMASSDNVDSAQALYNVFTLY